MWPFKNHDKMDGKDDDRRQDDELKRKMREEQLDIAARLQMIEQRRQVMTRTKTRRQVT